MTSPVVRCGGETGGQGKELSSLEVSRYCETSQIQGGKEWPKGIKTAGRDEKGERAKVNKRKGNSTSKKGRRREADGDGDGEGASEGEG